MLRHGVSIASASIVSGGHGTDGTDPWAIDTHGGTTRYSDVVHARSHFQGLEYLGARAPMFIMVLVRQTVPQLPSAQLRRRLLRLGRHFPGQASTGLWISSCAHHAQPFAWDREAGARHGRAAFGAAFGFQPEWTVQLPFVTKRAQRCAGDGKVRTRAVMVWACEPIWCTPNHDSCSNNPQYIQFYTDVAYHRGYMHWAAVQSHLFAPGVTCRCEWQCSVAVT
jgi:hypothetical protein